VTDRTAPAGPPPAGPPDPPDAPAPPGALDADEREELARLRAEVARLREAAEASTPAAEGGGGDTRRRRRPGPGAGRATVAALLVIVGVVLAPLSVVSVWARGVVTDTDRYVETVAPLADDPALQRAIAAHLTDQVFEYVDVRGLTTEAFTALAERGSLPPVLADQLVALAGPLSAGARNFVEDRVLQVVETDAFAVAWAEANRTAHEQLVAALTGESGSAVQVAGGEVTVDLAAFLTVVKQRLVEAGFDLAQRIPAVQSDFVLFRSSDVERVQRGFRLLDAVGLWFPFVCVGLVGLGLYLSRRRRLTFIWAGLGLAAGMLVAGAVLALARERYLAGVPAGVLPTDAAATLFDTLVRFLRDALRSVFLVGVLAALGAFLAGPSVTATTLRRWGRQVLTAASNGLATLGLDLTPVSHRLAPRLPLVRGVVLAAAFVVVLLERYRTPEQVGRMAVAVVVVLVLLELLGTPPRRATPADRPAATTVPAPS
jgi:hypothetical protein